MVSDRKPDYAKMVVEAEAAVAAVKDPELRRVAFERILSAPPATSRKASIREKTAPTAARGRSKKTASRGPMAYVQVLIDDGFFKTPRTIADVKAALANSGHHIPLTSLSGPLQSLTQQRMLRRQKNSAKPGVKSTYAYSNW